MTAVAYAMQDHAPLADGTRAGAISIPEHLGGCGKTHTARTDDRGHVYYQCDLCAPIAIERLYGFAATAHGVPLTPDETADRELAGRDAELAKNKVMADFLAEKTLQARGIQSAPAPSLLEQIAAMTPEQRADLAKLLGPVPAEPVTAAEAAAGPDRTQAETTAQPKGPKPTAPRRTTAR